MLAKSHATAAALGLTTTSSSTKAFAEALPVDDGWADVVISNGVINLCADKRTVFTEIRRVLRPGGRLQFADIAERRPSTAGSTARHRPLDRLNSGRAARAGWQKMLEEAGFADVTIGAVDTFGGRRGGTGAPSTYGYTF